MEQEKLDRAIRYVLRYAIEHGGKAYYNPCMYHLGFADNIPPSEAFNRELRKYGGLHYGEYAEEYDYDDAWDYFQIDERGGKYMEKVEPSGLGKIIRGLFTMCLSILQIPFVLEGWISYILNCVIKFLAKIFFPIAFVSFIWWPLDMLCSFSWMLCDWLKHVIWDKGFTWEASSRRWLSRFPKL